MNQASKAVAATPLTKISFESDGTVAGSKLVVNGKEVKDLRALHLSLWDDEYERSVGLSYTVGDKSTALTDGQVGSVTTYRLQPKRESATAASATLVAEQGVPDRLIPAAAMRDLYASNFGSGATR